MGKIFLLYKVLPVFLLFFFFVNSVYAIRIYPDTLRIEFVPNFEGSFEFRVGGAEKIEVYKKGALADYVYFSQTIFENQGIFTVTVKLPEHIDTPGDNIILIGAREYSDKGGTVGGVAAIQTPIVIRVPYPGVYIDTGLSVPDSSVDETITITIPIKNLGTNDIKSASASIFIFDSDNVMVKTIHTKGISVKSRSESNLVVSLNTTAMRSGTYRAIANLTYDGNHMSFEKYFKIGVLSVNILDYTREFLKDKISRFELEVESKWNSRIDNLFSEIQIFNTTKYIDTLRTPTVVLDPWQKTKLTAFFDTSDLGVGTYYAKITIFYADTSLTLDGEVLIINPQEPPIYKYKSIQPAKVLTVLMTIILLFVVIHIMFISKKKDK